MPGNKRRPRSVHSPEAILSVSISVWLGAIFVLIGAINVWLMLQSSARIREAKANTRLIAAHRIGGYVFIGLFCVLGYAMLSRLGSSGAGAASGTVVHMTLAMVLSPLLFVKVLVARYYRNFYSLLLPLGLLIFVLAFVLVGITAGPYLASQTRMQTVSLPTLDLPPASIDLNLASATMEKRCAKCHNLDRIVGARKDARGWQATVDRMRVLPNSGISEADARLIVSYLASQMAPKGGAAVAGLEVAKALVDQRCGRCHTLDRVYQTRQTPDDWRATVDRMVQYAAGGAGALQPGEAEQIIAYLSQTHQPGSEATAQQATATSAQSATPAYSDRKATGLLAFLCLGLLALIIRRPSSPSEKPQNSNKTPANASSPSQPLVLKLASITAQTADSKTLRFILPHDRRLIARPGQFLTFSFLFDGQKITRSYSICSSPVRSGYVEITPKRVSAGWASVFLNDRAEVGMTVEATGPFGRFQFDENEHSSVVMLAAGSGITPMIAMLRYMDDVRLETIATLLYFVRTRHDVIFERELEKLRTRLKNFRWHVVLSQPHDEWTGPRGRISREFIESMVPDVDTRDFFVCGPPGFTETSNSILTTLGVKPERINQETFGGPPTKAPAPDPTATTAAEVQFVRSGITCEIRGGQTLLQAAEEHGVPIPSSCRQGQCGTCKTKLLEGEVQMDAEAGLDDVSRANGFVLTCVGHPRGPVKLDV